MGARATRWHELLAAPVVDDRGRCRPWVRLAPGEWPFVGPVLTGEQRVSVVRTARREQIARVGLAVYLAQRLMLAMLFVAVILSVTPIATSLVSGGLSGVGLVVRLAASAVLGFAGGTVLSPGINRLVRWMDGASLRAALLRLRLCASCGYSLEGALDQPDGCAVCPECGAAWRIRGERALDGAED